MPLKIFLQPPKIFKKINLFIFIIIFIFGGYLIYQSKDFLLGPRISVKNLAEYSAADNQFFEIEGGAKNISEFYLNARKIFTDKKGNFKENLLLAKGANFIQLKAEDKFGNQAIKNFYVFF